MSCTRCNYCFTSFLPSESITKKRNEVHDEIANIESRFVASRAQENNGTNDEQKHNETTPTKHNRRTSHDDDDNDSNYNSDDDLMIHPNDESNLAPDISIVKKEQGLFIASEAPCVVI